MSDPLAGWPGAWPPTEPDRRDKPPPSGRSKPVEPEPDTPETRDPRVEFEESDVRGKEGNR